MLKVREFESQQRRQYFLAIKNNFEYIFTVKIIVFKIDPT